MSNDLPTVFISYSRRNSEFAKTLVDDLKNLDTGVWVDYVEITVGDDLHDKIGSAIERTDFFCVILSEESISSSWVKDELRQAIETQKEVNRKKVLPVKIDNSKTPYFLKGIVYADFSESYEYGLKELLRAINPKKYNATKSLDSQLSDFYLEKASTNLNNQRPEKGLSFLDKSLSLDNENLMASFVKGQFLFNSGDIPSSEEYFLKTANNIPGIGLLSVNYLADIERIKGLRNAIVLLEDSIPMGNNNFEILFKLGDYYRALVIESYSNKDYKLINKFQGSKEHFHKDCQNAQKHLRSALFKCTDSRNKASILFFMKEILQIYLPNDQEFSLAYLDEYIIEVEKFGTPEIKNYLDIIWFYASNYQFELARQYTGKLFSRIPKDDALLEKINNAIKDCENDKKNKVGDDQVMTTTRLTFDALKNNIYNQSVEFHPSLIDQTSMVNKNTGISIPLRFDNK